MLLKTRVHQFRNKVYTTKNGIWAMGAAVPKHCNVLAVLRQGDDPMGILIPGSNIVTNDGDTYYAQRMSVNTSSVQTFTWHELQSAGTPGKTANRSNFTAITDADVANSAGYSKTADADGDNTGAGADICTHLGEWAKVDFSTTGSEITHGIITNPTPGASEICLTGYAFAAAFDKTADDTLKVFVNHEALGV